MAGEPPVIGAPGATPDDGPVEHTPATASEDDPPTTTVPRRSRRRAARARFRHLVAVIEEGDERRVEAEVLRLSQGWRVLAPLAMCVGAFVLLFQGLRRLWTNWRLILVEVVPAMWAWATMLDLKVHVLYGHEFQQWRGPAAIVLVAGAAVLTVGAFYLNAVFAFALVEPEGAPIRPAFANVNRHLWLVSGIAFAVGVALGLSAFVVPRWGLGWFTMALGIAVAAQMLASVLVPSRLVGKRTSTQPRRDRVVAGGIAAVLGAVVCAPPYALGRFGIVLLGSHGLVVLGVTLLVIGFALHSGTSGAVKAIKVSAKAGAGRAAIGHPASRSTVDDGSRTPRPAGHTRAGAGPLGSGPGAPLLLHTTTFDEGSPDG